MPEPDDVLASDLSPSDRVTIPMPGRGKSVGLIVVMSAIVLGLWAASWFAWRKNSAGIVSASGGTSLIPAAVFGAVVLVLAARVITRRVAFFSDRLEVHNGIWPAKIAFRDVTGFRMGVTRSLRGTWTTVWAQDRTGFDRTICSVPGAPEGNRELLDLVRRLNSWCGAEPDVVRAMAEADSVLRMEEATRRLAAADGEDGGPPGR